MDVSVLFCSLVPRCTFKGVLMKEQGDPQGRLGIRSVQRCWFFLLRVQNLR